MKRYIALVNLSKVFKIPAFRNGTKERRFRHHFSLSPIGRFVEENRISYFVQNTVWSHLAYVVFTLDEENLTLMKIMGLQLTEHPNRI